MESKRSGRELAEDNVGRFLEWIAERDAAQDWQEYERGGKLNRPLRVGDLVMYTENDYKLGLRNGSLGVVRRAFSVRDIESVCCVCKFDGADFELRSAHVCALAHAYSITVHKSQGSQFDRVIGPVRNSRLLDQALVYTAITRGIEQVVLVGDVDAIRSAIAAPASAARRHVSLPALLMRQYDNTE